MRSKNKCTKKNISGCQITIKVPLAFQNGSGTVGRSLSDTNNFITLEGVNLLPVTTIASGRT